VAEAATNARMEERRVDVERRSRLPVVSAQSVYSMRGLAKSQFMAGVNLSWTMFDGFKSRNAVQAAASRAEAQRIRAERARRDAALDIHQQLQSRREAHDLIAMAREGLASAQEAYRVAIVRFQEGLSTSAELSDVQATLATALNDYIQSVNDLNVAEIRLAKSLGVDLGAFIAREARPTVPTASLSHQEPAHDR
jgi:outer membrane protein TolC